MLKRLIALGLLAALLSAPLAGLGEEAFSLETLLQYRAGIASVNGTGYVMVTDKHSSLKAYFTTDGVQASPYMYSNLSYLSYGFCVGFNEAGDNTRGLATLNGVRLTEEKYGHFIAYSSRWAVGYVLSPATEEAYGFKRGNEFFDVEQVDVLYIPDPDAPAQVVASLSGDAFATAAAHGDYLAVQNGEGAVTLYDSAFQPLDYPMTDPKAAIYGVVDYEVINKATGQLLMDGFVEAKEVTMGGELCLICTRYNFKGEKVSGILDTEGNEILPVEYYNPTVAGNYLIMSDNTGKLKGLFSLAEKKFLVPCEYNNIMAGRVSTDNYVHNGYVAVENGDLRGYVDVRTGALSCEVKYDRKAVTTIGCSTFWKVEDGVYMLAAADGVETEVHVDSIEANTRGDGHYLVAKKDGWFGLIDWHGNVLLPFEHKWQIVITDDSKAIIRTSTGQQIDLIIPGEEEAHE